MKNPMTRHACRAVALLLCLSSSRICAQPDFEFENNWLQWVSFVTGQDEGIEQNLADNFSWMQDQGYTHLRFFGIYPNGLHAFPSPTLDANGYPTDPLFESVLPQLVAKADEYGIAINFDGWEVIAESNQDPTVPGVDFMTEDEVADVVREVLAFGVARITEEQFNASYLRAIQAATQESGAIHETTAGVWWPDSSVADEQLASVFTFYPYDQQEADALGLMSSRFATLGVTHVFAEGARYYGRPFSLAVGSFGFLEAENWRNVLLVAQLQHLPDRFSVEETETDFTIWNPSFNFADYVGDELLALAGEAIGERPVANFVIDSAVIPSTSIRPAYETFLTNCPAVANTFTLLGYRVVTTIDSVLPEAGAYFVALAGGAEAESAAPLPSYVLPLLSNEAPVFFQPTYGIPDENDAADWIPFREFFGLPGGDTQTLGDVTPEVVDFGAANVRWGGWVVSLLPVLEWILKDQIDTTHVQVPLSTELVGEDVALVLQGGNKILINSNLLHLEASYILSELLGGPLRAPLTADVVVTADRVLVYAEYDGTVDLDLPWSGDAQVERYDPFGNEVQNETLPLGGRYVEDLSRGEFVFLRDVPATAIPAVSTWGLAIMILLVLTAGTAVLGRSERAL
jgi:hypothetical protein